MPGNSSQHSTKSQYVPFDFQETNENDTNNSYNFTCSSPICINTNTVPCNTIFPALDDYDEQLSRNIKYLLFRNKNNPTSILLIIFYHHSSAIKPYGGNDFVKKQLGNAVSKRLSQQQINTKQDTISSYQYNTNYANNPYSINSYTKSNEMSKFQQYSSPNSNKVHYPTQMQFQQPYNNVQPLNQYYFTSNSTGTTEQPSTNSYSIHKKYY